MRKYFKETNGGLKSNISHSLNKNSHSDLDLSLILIEYELELHLSKKETPRL